MTTIMTQCETQELTTKVMNHSVYFEDKKYYYTDFFVALNSQDIQMSFAQLSQEVWIIDEDVDRFQQKIRDKIASLKTEEVEKLLAYEHI